jgi:predicted DNA-binding protein
MKLKKASEEEKDSNLPVSFRLSKEPYNKLKVMAKVLEKNMSKVLEEVILQGYEAVLKDYPEDTKAEEARQKKAALKAK